MIVEAAAGLFGERGVEATTVADICARADVAHQTFFGHLVRRGRAEGSVSRAHAIEDQAALIFGGFSQLMFEWAHRRDFPIAERSARMARLLADALAPRPGERSRRS